MTESGVTESVLPALPTYLVPETLSDAQGSSCPRTLYCQLNQPNDRSRNVGINRNLCEVTSKRSSKLPVELCIRRGFHCRHHLAVNFPILSCVEDAVSLLGLETIPVVAG